MTLSCGVQVDQLDDPAQSFVVLWENESQDLREERFDESERKMFNYVPSARIQSCEGCSFVIVVAWVMKKVKWVIVMTQKLGSTLSLIWAQVWADIKLETSCKFAGNHQVKIEKSVTKCKNDFENRFHCTKRHSLVSRVFEPLLVIKEWVGRRSGLTPSHEWKAFAYWELRSPSLHYISLNDLGDAARHCTVEYL